MMTSATNVERSVIELDHGIVVYPPRREGGRWRAVWYENGERTQCESIAEGRLAVKLEKVRTRLEAGAPNMARPGADLIAFYLSADRLPVDKRWSRRHADTQRRLCGRFALPVIENVTCEDITTAHTQKIVNAAPTPGEGNRLRRMLSAMVNAGIDAGYLANQRLAKVHWQAGDRPVPEQAATVAGESVLWVDPAEIPSAGDVAALGRALAGSGRPDAVRDELMMYAAAYSGLRWGELTSLGIDQMGTEDRVISVTRKVVEIGGKLYVEIPKNRKLRRTIFPRLTPDGYPLAERLAARAEEAKAERRTGGNPLGLMFPSPRGTYWRSSNFRGRILGPAFAAAGWRDGNGDGSWTWHSLRHVFCTTALFTWKLDATDVSRMAGHANYRVTLDMYVGTTSGILDRARSATE